MILLLVLVLCKLQYCLIIDLLSSRKRPCVEKTPEMLKICVLYSLYTTNNYIHLLIINHPRPTMVRAQGTNVALLTGAACNFSLPHPLPKCNVTVLTRPSHCKVYLSYQTPDTHTPTYCSWYTLYLPFLETCGVVELTELATKMAGMVQQSDHHVPQRKQIMVRTMERV